MWPRSAPWASRSSKLAGARSSLFCISWHGQRPQGRGPDSESEEEQRRPLRAERGGSGSAPAKPWGKSPRAELPGGSAWQRPAWRFTCNASRPPGSPRAFQSRGLPGAEDAAAGSPPGQGATSGSPRCQPPSPARGRRAWEELGSTSPCSSRSSRGGRQPPRAGRRGRSQQSARSGRRPKLPGTRSESSPPRVLSTEEAALNEAILRDLNRSRMQLEDRRVPYSPLPSELPVPQALKLGASQTLPSRQRAASTALCSRRFLGDELSGHHDRFGAAALGSSCTPSSWTSHGGGASGCWAPSSACSWSSGPSPFGGASAATVAAGETELQSTQRLYEAKLLLAEMMTPRSGCGRCLDGSRGQSRCCRHHERRSQRRFDSAPPQSTQASSSRQRPATACSRPRARAEAPAPQEQRREEVTPLQPLNGRMPHFPAASNLTSPEQARGRKGKFGKSEPCETVASPPSRGKGAAGKRSDDDGKDGDAEFCRLLEAALAEEEEPRERPAAAEEEPEPELDAEFRRLLEAALGEAKQEPSVEAQVVACLPGAVIPEDEQADDDAEFCKMLQAALAEAKSNAAEAQAPRGAASTEGAPAEGGELCRVLEAALQDGAAAPVRGRGPAAAASGGGAGAGGGAAGVAPGARGQATKPTVRLHRDLAEALAERSRCEIAWQAPRAG